MPTAGSKTREWSFTYIANLSCLKPKRTSLGIVSMGMQSYPQESANCESYSLNRYKSEAELSTAFKSIQVLDKKGENVPVHRKVCPLSTTTILN